MKHLALTLNVARLLSIVVVLPLLEGCQGVLFVGAHAGMAASTAMQARPDRKLDFEIEVKTADSRELRFKGSTECPHSVGVDRSGYSTKTSYSSVVDAGEHWVLSGINCDNEMVHKAEILRDYRLYRVINEAQAKVYFVTAGASAEIISSSFQSSIQSSSEEPHSHFGKYADGPYFYQKIFLNSPRAAVSTKYTKPLVVYEGTNVCGKQNSDGIAIDTTAFFPHHRRDYGAITAIEEGHLEYRPDDDGWVPTPGIHPSRPLDVASRSPATGCIRLIFAGNKFIVSQGAVGSVLYVPQEKAFYRITRVRRNDIRNRIKEETNWRSCGKPQGIDRFARGTIYITDPVTSAAARQNEDGSYSCRRPWYGGYIF